MTFGRDKYWEKQMNFTIFEPKKKENRDLKEFFDKKDDKIA